MIPLFEVANHLIQDDEVDRSVDGDQCEEKDQSKEKAKLSLNRYAAISDTD